jgi:hypothetical protein
MHVDAGHLNAGQGCSMGINSAGAFIGDAELVFLLAGRNLRMGLGVDIRIDAERHMRLLAFAHGAGVQHFQFGFGFDVETVDAGVERQVHFGGCLADTGKHDAVGRNAGGQRPAQFATRYHVDTGAQTSERLQHGLVRIRLHRVADHGVDIGEGFGEDRVVPFQRCGGIAVERCAHRLGYVDDGDVFRKENAVTIFEMVHWCALLQEGIEEETLAWRFILLFGAARRRLGVDRRG